MAVSIHDARFLFRKVHSNSTGPAQSTAERLKDRGHTSLPSTMRLTREFLHSTYLQLHVVLLPSKTPQLPCSSVHAVQFATWQGCVLGDQLSKIAQTAPFELQEGPTPAALRASKPGTSCSTVI